MRYPGEALTATLYYMYCQHTYNYMIGMLAIIFPRAFEPGGF